MVSHIGIIAYVPCFDNALSQLAEIYKSKNYTIKEYSQKVHLKISLFYYWIYLHDIHTLFLCGCLAVFMKILCYLVAVRFCFPAVHHK